MGGKLGSDWCKVRYNWLTMWARVRASLKLQSQEGCHEDCSFECLKPVRWC